MTDSLRQYSAPRVNPKHAQPIRQVDKPEPGWFRMKLVKGGPVVPARITYGPAIDPETGEAQAERSAVWCGEINGEPDPNPTPTPGEVVMRIWLSGERIDEREYGFLLADRQWAARYAPHLPEAQPRKPVDLSTLDPKTLF